MRNMIQIPLNVFLGSILMIVALVGVIIVFPLILGLVKPNRYYGVRIPKAFTSDENWYKLNRFGGKIMFVSFLLLLVLGIAVIALPIPLTPTLITVISLIPSVLMIGSLLPILMYARTL